MLGPKQFPLDRLLAIFYTIAGIQVQPSVNILSQVWSLSLYSELKCVCVDICNVAVFGDLLTVHHSLDLAI